MTRTLFPLMALWVALVITPRAHAEMVESYAIVIGSNEGGEGQRPLSYAEGDAERMAQLFTELGRTPKENITLLRQPTPQAVEAALSELRTRLRARQEAGRKTQVLFYYSGHARAQALSLGREELPLTRLRDALTLPSTLTVVVLDACQSGAFSGVKGASPAADFSMSSVDGLHSRGIAVLASSTGSELSQESPELSGSYFTHHLTVALRGAGDVDGNGRVSLDEAYRYAYDRTLSDTARTQIGMQHATLETNLTGRGDVALTYPSDADALLVLPAALSGRVLVQRAGRGGVMAELVKAAGAPLWLALPGGGYDVLLRDERRPRVARECAVTLVRGGSHELSPASCREVTLPDPTKKGDAAQAARHETWFVELGISVSSMPDGEYIDTLEQFRYQPSLAHRLFADGERLQLFVDGALGYALHPNLSLLARFDTFEMRTFNRQLSGPNWQGRKDAFDWSTRAASLGARGRLPLFKEHIVAVAEVTLGLAIARSTYEAEEVYDKQWHFGPALRGAVGFTFGLGEHFGIYLLGGYSVVRALDNELGETHEDGGFFGSFGLRVRGLKGGL